MIDFCAMKRRYLPVKLRNGMIINVEEPKVKVMDMIMSIQKAAFNQNEDTKKEKLSKEKLDEINSIYKNISMAASMCLSKNKEKKKYGVEWVKENMTMDEMFVLVSGIVEWANKEKPKN